MRIIVPFFLIALAGHLVGMETPRSSSPSSTSTKAKRGSTLIDEPITIEVEGSVGLPTQEMSGRTWDESAIMNDSDDSSEKRTPHNKKSPRKHNDKKYKQEQSDEEHDPQSPRVRRLTSLIKDLRNRSDSSASSSSVHKLTQVYNAINRKYTQQRNHVADLLIALNGLEPAKAQQYLLMQITQNPDLQNLDEVTLQLCGAVARKEKGGANELLKAMLPPDYQMLLVASEAKKNSDEQSRSRTGSHESNSSLGKSISGVLKGRKGAVVGLLTTLFLGLATNLTTYFVGSNPATLTQCNSQLSTCQVALDTCTKLLNGTH